MGGYSDKDLWNVDTYDEELQEYLTIYNEKTGSSWTLDNVKGSGVEQFFYTVIQQDIKLQTGIVDVQIHIISLLRRFEFQLKRPSCVPDRLVEELKKIGYTAAVYTPVSDINGLVVSSGQMAIVIKEAVDNLNKLAVLLNTSAAGGIETLGDITATAAANNGQLMNFKFFQASKLTPFNVKVQYTLSSSRIGLIPSPEEIRQKVVDNFNAYYKIGSGFEPELLLSRVDYDIFSYINVQYSLDSSATWKNGRYLPPYNNLVEITPADVVVEVVPGNLTALEAKE